MAGIKKQASGRSRGRGNLRSREQNGADNGKLKNVTDYRHDEAKRTNNPPAKIAAEGTVPLMPKIRYEYSPRLGPVLRFDSTGQSDRLPELLEKAQRGPLTAAEANLLAEALRNREPWLEWANKRERKWFEVDPVALHIHERVSTQAILRVAARQDIEPSLFADPQQQYHEAVQFYRHPIPWTNRLILGDSLQVMTSLSRREDLAGRIQMIYMDPPYGIKFASNFQPQVGKRDVKESEEHLTREPEMVKAYRDTWHLGIHSYLTYLRDRLVIAKELLADSGSVFVQISDENLHRVREILDEVFGADNFCSVITVWKTSSATSSLIAATSDYLLWYAKAISLVKYREQYVEKDPKEPSSGGGEYKYAVLANGERRSAKACSNGELETSRLFRPSPTTSQSGSDSTRMPVELEGQSFTPGPGGWKTNTEGFKRLDSAERLMPRDKSISYIRYLDDFKVVPVPNLWTDTRWGFDASEKRYVVETNPKVITRCMLMTTDPGDLAGC
jgi:adenine-specific DNA-methyltransferase